MTSRSAGLGSQQLHWDDAGQLTSITGSTAGTSSFEYAADGRLLIQKDPGAVTLYLPGEQVTLATATQAVSGVRYYPLPGGGIGYRTGTGTSYGFEITSPAGTGVLALDHTAQVPSWRQFTPYGAPRGTPVTWIDNRGFLDKPADTATGLTITGARSYDPVTGRFISPDPVLDPASPQQLNGYSYAGSNPVTNADPTGLYAVGPGGCGPQTYPCPGSGPGSTGGGTWNGGGNPCPSYLAGCPGFAGGGGTGTGTGTWNGGSQGNAPPSSASRGDSQAAQLRRSELAYIIQMARADQNQYGLDCTGSRLENLGACPQEVLGVQYQLWASGTTRDQFLAQIAMAIIPVPGVDDLSGLAEIADATLTTTEDVPSVIFRTGSRTDGALTDPSGVSFRSSVSSSADGQQIFRPGDKIWSVQTN